MALDKNQIAQRIAQELKHNMYVNLGIGIPTLVANFIPRGIDIEFQSEIPKGVKHSCGESLRG